MMDLKHVTELNFFFIYLHFLAMPTFWHSLSSYQNLVASFVRVNRVIAIHFF